MKKFFLVLMIVCTIPLFGCAKGVKSFQKEEPNDVDLLEKDIIEYDSLDMINDSFANIENESFSHLIFSDNLNLNNEEIVQSITLKKSSGFFEKESDLIDFFFR